MKINNEAISNKFINLLQQNLGEKPDINKIGKEASEIMYKHGFDDNSNNFNPVIPEINLKVEYKNRKLSLAFREQPGPWTVFQI